MYAMEIHLLYIKILWCIYLLFFVRFPIDLCPIFTKSWRTYFHILQIDKTSYYNYTTRVSISQPKKVHFYQNFWLFLSVLYKCRKTPVISFFNHHAENSSARRWYAIHTQHFPWFAHLYVHEQFIELLFSQDIKIHPISPLFFLFACARQHRCIQMLLYHIFLLFSIFFVFSFEMRLPDKNNRPNKNVQPALSMVCYLILFYSTTLPLI